MHKAVSPKETQDEVVANCTGAKWGCVACKKVLFENFEKELIPLRTKREQLSVDQVRAGDRRRRGEGASHRGRDDEGSARGHGPRQSRDVIRRARSLDARASLLGSVAAACTRTAPDATPEGAVRLFVEKMESGAEDPRAMREAYQLLGPHARANLKERADRASKGQGRRYEPFEMLAEGRFGLKFRPKTMTREDRRRGRLRRGPRRRPRGARDRALRRARRPHGASSRSSPTCRPRSAAATAASEPRHLNDRPRFGDESRSVI